jgi:RNA recognition motif-containing protein
MALRFRHVSASFISRTTTNICYLFSTTTHDNFKLCSSGNHSNIFTHKKQHVMTFVRNKTTSSNLRQSSQDYSSSWMSKNQEYESNFNFDDSNDANKRTEKQKRRRNDKRRENYNERVIESIVDGNAIRESKFRGTRVFVQGLPTHITWKELKDHFKIAGEVVFASVSIDTKTKMSKGCGIVQYETTEMAKNAIKIMRDHPLDGQSLYVREDVQKDSNPIDYESSERRSKGLLPKSTNIWRCADEDTMIDMDKALLEKVQTLIKARDQARIRKNYDASDNIREELKQKYSIHIDDRLKMWWISVDNNVPQIISNIKGEGRWGNLKPWRQIPTTPENDMCVSADLVNGLLKQRDIARREKDFKTADKLLEQARTCPDGGLHLRIHDESRTWRIWTEAPPPRAEVTINDDDKKPARKMTATEECISLVSKYEPDKVKEVEKLLLKFPGREYNILNRLKENYFPG